MKKYIPILKKTRLFAGISEEEIVGMLSCLDAKLYHFSKGAYVIRQGEQMGHITVLVEGELHIQNEDYWGNRTIVSRIGVGELFGEAYLSPALSGIQNDVVAVADSVVIFFGVRCVMTTCSSACRVHNMVIRNLFCAISEKTQRLMKKLGHMSKRTTREKLLSYLSEEAKKQHSACFDIPFNRQQLADFLSVDRSAMSNELCKMRDEGIIEFHKNRFRLL